MGTSSEEKKTNLNEESNGGVAVASDQLNAVLALVLDDNEEDQDGEKVDDDKQGVTTDASSSSSSSSTEGETNKDKQDKQAKEAAKGGLTTAVSKTPSDHIMRYVKEGGPEEETAQILTLTSAEESGESRTAAPTPEEEEEGRAPPPARNASSSGSLSMLDGVPGAYSANGTQVERLPMIHRNSFGSIPFIDGIEDEGDDLAASQDQGYSSDEGGNGNEENERNGSGARGSGDEETGTAIASSTTSGGLAVANLVREHPDHLPRATQHHHRDDHDLLQGADRKKAKDQQEQSRLKTCLCYWGIALVVFVGIVAVLSVISYNEEDDYGNPDNNPMATAAGGEGANGITTTLPTMSPSGSPTSIEGSILSLLPEETILAATQDAPDSPQSKALQWLLQDQQQDHESSFDHDEEPQQRIIQKFVLATLYFATGGEGWTNNTNWLNHNIDVCNWYTKTDYARKRIISSLFDGYLEGMLEPLPQETKCDPSTGLYEHLWLDGNNLVGSSIPEELYLLTSLKSLSIGFNTKLKGTISTRIGALTQLQALHLGDMDWTGVIPSQIGRLSQLEHFEIWGSTFQLGGTLPTEMWQLTNLIHLGIAASPQLRGTIPSQIGTFQKLTWLAMLYCGFSGTIPSEIGKVENFKVINLDTNQFTGTIPTEIGLLQKTKLLAILGNQMGGTLPTELGELTASTLLSVLGNQFTGTLPSELGRLTELTITLNLKNNFLTGTIPKEFGLFSSLYELEFQGNQFTGRIPSELGQLSSIGQLTFANNSLSGTVPQEFSALSPTLHALSLQGNPLLSGVIPEEFCSLNNTCVRNAWNTYGCNLEVGISFDCTEALTGCECTV